MNHAFLGLSLEFTLRNLASLYQHSELQLAAQQKAKYTDQWKMRAQHSHIIQTISGDQTFSFAIATWVWSWA